MILSSVWAAQVWRLTWPSSTNHFFKSASCTSAPERAWCHCLCNVCSCHLPRMIYKVYPMSELLHDSFFKNFFLLSHRTSYFPLQRTLTTWMFSFDEYAWRRNVVLDVSLGEEASLCPACPHWRLSSACRCSTRLSYYFLSSAKTSTNTYREPETQTKSVEFLFNWRT